MVMVMLLLPINTISLPAENIYASSIVKITKSSQVIMEHEGVCNSYALAFYTMATAEGIPCIVISVTPYFSYRKIRKFAID
ncbi:MAG: hypothetical protein ACLRTZ_09585 [Agathobacter sp.]|jgi:transglutaminase/protease-like cytokinesis protein 3